ncbi:MAG: cytochrome c [Deltaproteobacteria bacterium]|nr:cytochrome c [Deltaproteobacteria bacterium]
MKPAWLLVVVVLGAAGCSTDPTTPRWEYFPDMVSAVAYEAYSPNPITRDGKTMLAPAPNTIARGAVPFRYGVGPGEAADAGRQLHNPLAPSPAVLARGQKVFETFCLPCHGAAGAGDGPMIPKFSKPPSLLAERARTIPDGHIFHIITRGQNLMPSHGAQVQPHDRWQVIHYLRALQAAAVQTAQAPSAPGEQP